MKTVSIYFDGGTNAKRSYGSFEIRGMDPDACLVPIRVNRMSFERRVTSCEAEYMTLLAALERAQRDLSWLGNLTIYTDSKAVERQITLNGSNRTECLRELSLKVRNMLKRWRHWKVQWQPRFLNKQRFGH